MLGHLVSAALALCMIALPDSRVSGSTAGWALGIRQRNIHRVLLPGTQHVAPPWFYVTSVVGFRFGAERLLVLATLLETVQESLVSAFSLLARSHSDQAFCMQ